MSDWDTLRAKYPTFTDEQILLVIFDEGDDLNEEDAMTYLDDVDVPDEWVPLEELFDIGAKNVV